MATRTDIKDIPQADIDKIRDTFESSPQIRQLRIRQNLLQRQGDYRGAMLIARKIEGLFTHTMSELLTEVDRECQNVNIATANIPIETAERLNEIIVTLQLAIDIVDTCIIDFNDELHSVDDTLTLESFDDIKELGERVKRKLDYFRKHSELFNKISFADKSDNMYKMLRNKARSLINKAKEE